MGTGKSNSNELHYYSDRLKRKLEQIHLVPVTIVEAPSGYGKTTAIRDFLQNSLSQGTPIYWFTAMDEKPSAAFRRLCREIEKIDRYAGERLVKIGLPNAGTIGEASEALRLVQCKHETYLVIDNFHFLQDALPPAFFLALLEHGGQGLHVIIVTQMLKRDTLSIVAGHGLLHITVSDMRLNTRDICRYYALANVKITLEDAQEVERYTEGWIIAVYLQLSTFLETGTFSDTPGILALMEHLVWDKLTEEQQNFLLYLSPFEMVSVQQSCSLIGCDTLPEYALEAFASPFIHYDPTERQYEVHSILTELFIQKRGERGPAFERQCLLQAGDFCRDEGQTARALGFYMQIRDYERMLSLDLSEMNLEIINAVPFTELALDIAQNCPAEIKKKYILNMLRIAWILFMAGMNEQFEILMDELHTMPELLDNSDLLREWLLLSSYRNFPNLAEMTVIVRQAAPLFKSQYSQVILPTTLWCFGNYSPLTEFYTKPGEADRQADVLEEYITIYSRLTNGHGSGADALFRAELAYQRGNLNDAEILAYKAAFLAESKQQSVVLLGAAILLAHVALHKADTVGWERAIASMEHAASFDRQDTFVIRSVIDIIRGVLLNEFQNHMSIADWLQNADFEDRRLSPAVINIALFVHLVFLLHQGEFARVIGTAQAVRPAEGLLSPYGDIFACFLMATSHMALGNRVQAAAFVEDAARKALPDGLVSPFASYSQLLGDLVDEVIARDYPALLEKFKTVRKRFSQGWFTLREALFSGELPPDLTEREYEVAKLAATGLRNSEIAEKLVITESTVRSHMRTIFQKLQIDRRTRLAEKLK
ncbi:LuxR C-terminal-related transcriptional regulator [Syntrophomonas wolfei]|uniref:ATP-dependent transcriptional regulator-like protein n=1 Tax=Syntrophomonas wolfei subsp. wolfei (strain DSM 2245B / Goettingen) TaxID=335541 RepID=Q0AY14_SYNWW|nr:LuxR C-terminal-related transcriptional regulator [Syntrophomonas wolfei]ABI68390.1 ATP-dependent transcriptional regulator-like protein [Syntrophomonas wolfei subsp. wolfei str. Goettingen G311]